MNPPVPEGLNPLPQRLVTPDMTQWAKEILKAGTPIGETETRVFGTMTVIARVERHNWTIRKGKKVKGKYRGVTLYEGP